MSENLSFDEDTNTLTVGHATGVTYFMNGRVVEGEVKLDKTTTVVAKPVRGYQFKPGSQTEFTFEVDGESTSEETVDEPSPAKPVEVETAGADPENAQQQASSMPNFGRHL